MKIAVLASGGVDSSVALKLLQEEGHTLKAFYLKIWLEDELSFLGDCPWEEDLEQLRAVCDRLDVPLETVSLQREYRRSVVDSALEELRAGRTPSPDIFCNRWIKFGEFADRIDADFERVASGHYARIRRQGRTSRLLRSPDPVKDQTYFLSRLTQQQLSRAAFPIGHLAKDDVRRLAADFGLPNSDRPDSQGICFLGRIKYHEFVRCHLGERQGEIVDLESGRTLGEHMGFWFYTIGQRQGLGLGGGPWYVVGKDIEANRIFVSHGDLYQTRVRKQFAVTQLHWICGPPDKPRLQLKLRHGPKLIGCCLSSLDRQRCQVTMDEGDPGVAAGQFATFYAGEVCLGSGVIEG